MDAKDITTCASCEGLILPGDDILEILGRVCHAYHRPVTIFPVPVVEPVYT